MTGRIAAVMTETKEGGSRYVEKGRRARKKKGKNKYNVRWEVGGSREVK